MGFGIGVVRAACVGAVVAGTLLLPSVARAWLAITKADLPNLPQYCVDRHGPGLGVQGSGRRWQDVFGRAWGDMHHYCYALNHLNHAVRSLGDKTKRNYYADVVIGETGYVLSHGGRENWVLLPEAYTNMGRARTLQGRDKEAAGYFRKAIEAKADYAPAYLRLSELHMSAGDRKGALEIVEQGLARSPDDKGLSARYQDLTGKAFVPPPDVVKPAAESPGAEAPVAAIAPAEPQKPVGEPVAASAPAGTKVGTGGVIGN